MIGVGASRGLAGALLGALAAGGLVLGLQRKVLIGYALVALVPITSGLARGLPIPGLRFSEAFTVGAAVLVLGRTAGDRDRRWEAIDWAAAGFVGMHAVLGVFGSLVNASFTMRGVQLLVGPVQFFLLYRVVRATIETPRQRVVALRLLLLSSIPVSLLAIAQYIGVPGVQEFVEQITQSGVFDLWIWSQQPRATGPFESWHPLAGYLFLLMVLAIAEIADGDRDVMPMWATTSLLGLMTLALLVSQTLNVLAGLAIVAVMIAVMTRRVAQVLVPLAAVALVGAVIFGPVLLDRVASQEVDNPTSSGGVQTPQTIGYRFEVWTDQYIPAIVDHWMTGYGPELPPSIEWRYTESVYFTLLLRGGVALFGAYAVMMAVTWRDSWRRRNTTELPRRSVAMALVAGIVALVPMQTVFPYFTASGLPQVWWILAALMAGSSSATVRARSDARGLPSLGS